MVDDFSTLPIKFLKATRIRKGHFGIVHLVTVSPSTMEAMRIGGSTAYMDPRHADHDPRTFVLKTLPHPKDPNEHELARLRREALLLERAGALIKSGTGNRAIVPRLLGSHIDDRRPEDCWIALEYVDGQTVHQRLAEDVVKEPVPIASVRRFAAALWQSLGLLHSIGIAHRDLSRNNIILRRHGDGAAWDDVTLIDFGLACHAEVPLYADDPTFTTPIAGETDGFRVPNAADYYGRDMAAQMEYDIYQWACNVFVVATRRLFVREDYVGGPRGEISEDRLQEDILDPALVSALAIALRLDPAKREAQAIGDLIDPPTERSYNNEANELRRDMEQEIKALRSRVANFDREQQRLRAEGEEAFEKRLREAVALEREQLARVMTQEPFDGADDAQADERRHAHRERLRVHDQAATINDLQRELRDLRRRLDQAGPGHAEPDEVDILRRRVREIGRLERAAADGKIDLERAQRELAKLQEKVAAEVERRQRLELEVDRLNSELREFRSRSRS